MKKTSIARLAVVGALGLATAVLPGAPAMAAPSGCGSGYFCAYNSANYTGAAWKWAGDDGNWGNNTSSGVVASNHATSWFNNGTPCSYCDHVWIFDLPANSDGSQDGDLLDCLNPGTGVSKVSAWADNRASSHSWGGNCG